MRGDLIALREGLNKPRQPERLLYALPACHPVAGQNVLSLLPFYAESKLTPLEQFNDGSTNLLTTSVNLAYYERSHQIYPLESSVWGAKDN